MRASSWSTLQGHLLRQSTLQHPRSQWWPQGVFPQQPVQRSSVSRVAINRIGGLRRDDHSSRVISTARNGRVVLQALGRAGPSVTEVRPLHPLPSPPPLPFTVRVITLISSCLHSPLIRGTYSWIRISTTPSSSTMQSATASTGAGAQCW